ncbi:MAG: four helix bundle protein [Bacteroidales bacterium]|nr:four helix bundle protein [Bacteroidales bacterium]
MTPDDLKLRAKKFAHNCVKLTAYLPKTYLGNHIKDQLIRSATSTACNYRAVCIAQSKAAFISKISIVIEEADESLFWLEFIKEENLCNEIILTNLLSEALELSNIFAKSRITAQNK